MSNERAQYIWRCSINYHVPATGLRTVSIMLFMLSELTSETDSDTSNTATMKLIPALAIFEV